MWSLCQQLVDLPTGAVAGGHALVFSVLAFPSGIISTVAPDILIGTWVG